MLQKMQVQVLQIQKRNNEKLMQSVMSDKEYNSNNSFGKTYLEHREAVELSIEEFAELKKYCEKKIFFSLLPLSMNQV